METPEFKKSSSPDKILVMKKTTLTILLLFFTAISLISFSVIDTDSPHSPYKSMGGPPYNTNAPGEKTCSGIEGTSPCHSGGIPDNSGPATCSIISSGGTMYVPGQTYTITPTITHATRTRFGFQLTARRASNNANTGNLTVAIADTAKMWTQFPGYGTCQTCEFVMHKKTGSYFLGTTGSWSFTWTAPASNVGNIKMYCCFNAADNNNTETGDEIYYTTLTLTPSSTGINDLSDLSSLIDVFPNPTKGKFQVSGSGFQVSGLEVYNSMGEKIYSVVPSSDHSFIDISSQPKGLYFIKISSEGRTAVKKIIIQ